MLGLFRKKNKNIKAYKVKGMHCESCAAMIESDLEDIGVNSKCSYAKQTLEVGGNADINKVKKVLKRSGYELQDSYT